MCIRDRKYIGELGGILIVGLGAVQSLHRTHKAGQAGQAPVK